MNKLKLSGLVLLIMMSLMGCSRNMYLPEAHTYSNDFEIILQNSNVCTPGSCKKFVEFTAFGGKFHKFEFGSITLNVLGISSTQLANAIVASCKKTKTTLQVKVPVTLNLYSISTLSTDAKPVLSDTCD